MTNQILLWTVLFPSVASLLSLFFCKKSELVGKMYLLAVTAINLVMVVMLFKQQLTYIFPWGPMIRFSLRLDAFSSFVLAAGGIFGFLIALYTISFMGERKQVNHFYFYYLLTLGLLNGALLANNLLLMLFFWEGMLVTMFGMIYAGGREDAFKTAIKAFIIAGTADLCLMLGIGLTIFISGSTEMSSVSIALGGPHSALISLTFVLLMIGATAKAGSMPFHSWIPDAAVDAPLPFMALVPAALEKLLGIYFLARITLDMFKLTGDSWLSTLMMILGAVTILLAVMMALIQKDFKRLLSFHAISQVGYMILGIGTCTPVGVAGGIFHMINHAMYKSCLFLTGGIVERQTGTTDLKKLGNLARKLPVTFTCFVIAAASISGVPPFNGFFSKELVYDGALQRGWIFYAAALLGSFLTAASFLKLGHAAFLKNPKGEAKAAVKEAPWNMLLPVVVIAALCILFGVYNPLPMTNLILPIKPDFFTAEHHYYGLPASLFLVVMTLVALGLALVNHLYGVKAGGSALAASDHIHHAPGLGAIYAKAEQRAFDPYELFLKLSNVIAKVASLIDKGIDYFYNKIAVGVAFACSRFIRRLHNGNHATYIAWSVVGFVVVVLYVIGGK